MCTFLGGAHFLKAISVFAASLDCWFIFNILSFSKFWFSPLQCQRNKIKYLKWISSQVKQRRLKWLEENEPLLRKYTQTELGFLFIDQWFLKIFNSELKSFLQYLKLFFAWSPYDDRTIFVTVIRCQAEAATIHQSILIIGLRKK